MTKLLLTNMVEAEKPKSKQNLNVKTNENNETTIIHSNGEYAIISS